jgi:hypothetical protein
MPSFCTAAFTRKSDAISAFVALVAVPFPPVSTRSADATVPGATSLNHLSPAKRIPVRLTTFPAIIVLEELFERHQFTAARQLVLGVQILLCEGFVFVNVLDGAEGQVVYVHSIQRITATNTCAQFVTRLIVLQTSAAFTVTT